MSLASQTRDDAEDRPFLVAALRAGVINYTAAARFLDVKGDTDAVSTALRRYADELPEYDAAPRDARVTMRSGIAAVDDPGDAESVIRVGGRAYADRKGGDYTAIVATGEIDATALGAVLRRLDVAEIDAIAAGVAADRLVAIVDRLEGANAVRVVEGALETVLEPA